jgi:hypothetical protein
MVEADERVQTVLQNVFLSSLIPELRPKVGLVGQHRKGSRVPNGPIPLLIVECRPFRMPPSAGVSWAPSRSERHGSRPDQVLRIDPFAEADGEADLEYAGGCAATVCEAQ